MTADLALVRTAGRSAAEVRSRLRALALVAGDLLAAVLAAVVCGLTAELLPALALAWILVVQLAGSYRAPVALVTARDAVRPPLRAAVAVGLVCWAAGSVVTLPDRLALATVLAAAGSAAVRRLAVPAGGTTRALLVTSTGRGEPGELTHRSGGRLVTAGICTPAELEMAVAVLEPDVVVVVPDDELAGRTLQRVAWQLESRRVPMLVHTRLADVEPGRAPLSRAGSLGLIHLRPAGRRGGRRVAKEALERSLAALALVLLAPVLLGIALAVRLDTPGPALFKQTRVREHGRTFTMWKFRTMRVGAHAARDELDSQFDAVLFKVRSDPRVTRIGRVLRRYSLDELPQLVNIVRGEMALVGPRPALPEEVAAYDHDPRRRMVVKPGLTGLWQVSGRSDLSWEETVRLDLDYVDNWSLGRDAVIVARTVAAVLGHRGAY